MGDVLYTGTPEKCRELMGQLKSGGLTEGDVKQLYAKAQETAQTAGQDKDTFSIYQIKGGDETRDFRFEPYDRLQAAGNVVDRANYELVYSAPLAPETSLEDIYTRFNIDHPKDFKGHSLSVSDVVVLHQDGQDAAHFVDSVGFREVPEFLQEQKQLTPDDLETGETVKTPRGTFHVTAMSREQIEAAGYGFHHQSDDGKYLIMGNGTRAFAVAAEQAQRDNPLKTAEQTIEQNGNMIDGIINNTPTVDELEAKVTMITGTVSYWTTETNAYVRSSFPIRFSASGSGLRCFPPTGCSMRSFTRQGIRRNVPSAARSLRQPLTVSNTAPSAGSVSPADKPPSA